MRYSTLADDLNMAEVTVGSLEKLLSDEDKREDSIDTGDLWAIHTALTDTFTDMRVCLDKVFAALGE
jgi:hypothetical protein